MTIEFDRAIAESSARAVIDLMRLLTEPTFNALIEAVINETARREVEKKEEADTTDFFNNDHHA